MKLKPYSSIVLTFAGLILVMMGLYFIFFRPALLPEDLRYMGSTLQNIKDNNPNILKWLQKVFCVIGGYVFTTGLLTIFIAATSFRKRSSGAFTIVAVAAITSIGLMTVVNFMIRSDFKWFLLTFTLPWAIALILYGLHK